MDIIGWTATAARILAETCSARIGDCIGMSAAGLVFMSLSWSGDGEADAMFFAAGMSFAAVGVLLTSIGCKGRARR